MNPAIKNVIPLKSTPTPPRSSLEINEEIERLRYKLDVRRQAEEKQAEIERLFRARLEAEREEARPQFEAWSARVREAEAKYLAAQQKMDEALSKLPLQNLLDAHTELYNVALARKTLADTVGLGGANMPVPPPPVTVGTFNTYSSTGAWLVGVMYAAIERMAQNDRVALKVQKP